MDKPTTRVFIGEHGRGCLGGRVAGAVSHHPACWRSAVVCVRQPGNCGEGHALTRTPVPAPPAGYFPRSTKERNVREELER